MFLCSRQELHALRHCQGNTIYNIENLDDLEHVIDKLRDDAIGICFDPMLAKVKTFIQRPVTWKLQRIAIELELVDPDGHP